MAEQIQAKQLSSLLQQNLPNYISFVQLFGSAVSKPLNEVNDVDIGVWIEEIDTSKKMETIQILQKLLETESNGKDIDIVFLNSASVFLRFEAFKGISLVQNDVDRYAKEYSLTCREYEDESAWMKRVLSYRNAG